jgi:hypothetical protein
VSAVVDGNRWAVRELRHRLEWGVVAGNFRGLRMHESLQGHVHRVKGIWSVWPVPGERLAEGDWLRPMALVWPTVALHVVLVRRDEF